MAMFGDVVVLTDTFRADFIFLNVPLFIKRVEADDLPTFVSLKDATPMVSVRLSNDSCSPTNRINFLRPSYLAFHRMSPRVCMG